MGIVFLLDSWRHRLMAGISDIIAHVETRVEALTGFTQSNERQSLRNEPATQIDGEFQVRIGSLVPVDNWGDATRDLMIKVFVDIGYGSLFTRETKYKTTGSNRESVAKDLENQDNYNSSTTGLVLVNLVSATIEEITNDYYIDTLEFDMRYRISWV